MCMVDKGLRTQSKSGLVVMKRCGSLIDLYLECYKILCRGAIGSPGHCLGNMREIRRKFRFTVENSNASKEVNF